LRGASNNALLGLIKPPAMPVVMTIVNYNGNNLTTDCLRAVGRQSLTDFEVIIVDNASRDNSLDEIKNFLAEHPLTHPVKIIPLSRNAGFAGGNLAGLDYSDAEYIALLNNDTEPEESWLRNLVEAMEECADIGICASKMIDVRTNVIDSACDGYSTLLKGYKRGEGEDSRRYDKQEYVFGACAGAALYRRKMLEQIGFLDEDFFLIHEDTDLNFRAQLAGWKVMYVPTALVYHKVRATIGHMSDMAVYYTLRNIEFVRIKNISLPLFIRCFLEFSLGTISELMYFAFKHGKMRLYLKAKMDVMRMLRIMFGKRTHQLQKIILIITQLSQFKN
jgi:GT2 family glycosyltransferase